MPEDRLLRVNNVADRLDISRETVRRLYHAGDLPGRKTSPRNIRIYESSIETYLKKINPDSL